MLKPRWTGLEPGKSGMIEALDKLFLGIRGKSLLWAKLARLESGIPSWEAVNSGELHRSALERCEAVEAKRVIAGLFLFCPQFAN